MNAGELSNSNPSINPSQMNDAPQHTSPRPRLERPITLEDIYGQNSRSQEENRSLMATVRNDVAAVRTDVVALTAVVNKQGELLSKTSERLGTAEENITKVNEAVNKGFSLVAEQRKEDVKVTSKFLEEAGYRDAAQLIRGETPEKGVLHAIGNFTVAPPKGWQTALISLGAAAGVVGGKMMYDSWVADKAAEEEVAPTRRGR